MMWKKFGICLLTLALVTGVAFAKPGENEKSQSLTGELRQLVTDDFESGQSQIRTVLRLDDGKEIQLQGADLGQFSGERITVSGTRIDGHNFAVDEIQETTSYRGSVSSLTSGPQNALVVLTKYASDPIPSYNLTDVGQVIDAAAAFWAEDSYNTFSLVPSYEDWTTISDTPGGDLSNLYPKVVAAVDPNVDFSQIDMLIIIGNIKFDQGGGQAFLSPISIDTDEGPQLMRVLSAETTLTMGQGVTQNIIKHEISHTVGLKHARQWLCDNVPLALTGCTAFGSDITNILRPFSSAEPAHHLHAHQKLKATYIDETQVTTVTETGIYTIDPLALPPGPGIRALRLATPAQSPLWIEYRQPIGMDVGLDAAPAGQSNTVFDGALLTLPLSLPDAGSGLVDADFSQGNPFDGLYYTLLPGVTLEDPFSGASITTLSATPSALTVAIEIDCQDADGDGYGVNCLAGDDCNDSDPGITDSGPAEVYIPAGEYLDLGTVRIDEVVYKTLDIVNTGCDTLAILGVNSPDPDFVLLNRTLFFPVPAKSTATLIIRFTPSALGPDRSDILIQTSDSDEQWITVTAIANVVTPQELDYSPGSFSALLPTGGQATQVLTIDNLGGNPLNYWIQNQDSVPWLDIDSADALASIPGFGQNQVELNFNADGQCSATGNVTLRMLANDDDEPEVFIPVTWEVYAAPDVSFSRDPATVIEFDDPPTNKPLRIDNDGCLPLTIQSITSSFGAFVAPFGGPVTLAPGASYTQNVTFDGCPRRGGIAQCGSSLTINTDDPDEGTTNFLLFGTGFAP